MFIGDSSRRGGEKSRLKVSVIYNAGQKAGLYLIALLQWVIACFI